MGRLFPQQFLPSTSVTGSVAQESHPSIAVHGRRWRLLAPVFRRTGTGTHWQPRRRQTDWRSFGSASHHQKLSGNSCATWFTRRGFAAGDNGMIHWEGLHCGICSVLLFIGYSNRKYYLTGWLQSPPSIVHEPLWFKFFPPQSFSWKFLSFAQPLLPSLPCTYC